ncbi:UTP21 [[Candida] subhashii]|uniref:UTP21 n=1 Tax=[Candida] subhashii TaxID=561895 RepID=A0A8J5QLL1_9ASCO|nr:UTP21 [[Candida] subhashii]KAG7665352.1 UTP21 [[Candida] subhashii]
MVEQVDKRRKIEGSTSTKVVRPSKIFSPFRVLGNVTDSTPFALGTLGSTFYAVTSVGRSFQIYDLATLHLLFVSQSQTPTKIACLAAHYHYVYAAYGNKIGIYKRGRLEHTLECSGSSSGYVSHMTIFGEYLVAATNEGDINVFKKTQGSKYQTELYTTIKVINSSIDGEVVGLIHPPTYLNKIVVACTGGTESSSKVTSISFRTDGSPHLVAGLNNGDLFFYDLNKKARVHILRNAHKDTHGGVSNVKFLNGQPIVLTNGGDNHLKEFVFDPNLTTSNSSIVSPPRHLRSRGGHSAPPIAIEFPQEEKSHFVFSASRDRSFWSFSLRKDAQAQEMSQRMHKSKDGKRQAGQVSSLREKFPEIFAITSSQAREGEWENVLTAHKDETFARTWDSRNKRVGRHVLNTIDNGKVKSVCISQCGNFGLVGSASGGIGVFNLQSGILRKKYVLHKNSVTGLAIDGMNRKMVSCGLDGIIGFYDFGKSKYLGKLQLDSPITSMVYHKSSDLVACALDDLSIVVVDVTTQKIVRVLYGHTNRISGMDFSPDGRWIVSVALDSTLRTWDLPTGGCIDGVVLPTVATSVRFSPLGDLLATTHVSGNGISLWTNRAQFKPISTRHVEEEDFSTILLPNVSGDAGSTLLDGALETEQDEEIPITERYDTVDQIDESLVTLSVGPRSKYNTLLHLDIIKQRNKPKEAPKKPEKAPFFLQLSGEAVGDRASVAEGKVQNDGNDTNQEEESRLRKLKTDDGYSFESEFTRLLREGSEKGDYTDFLTFLIKLAPSTTDLEIRSLNSFPPLDEMANFVEALNAGFKSNQNYELYEAIFAIFLKNHGDVIHNFPNDVRLHSALNDYQILQQEESMDELVKYCSGVINFVSRV